MTNTDELTLLRAADPLATTDLVTVDSAALAGLREAILASPVPSTSGRSEGRRNGPRRRAVVGALGVALVAACAVAAHEFLPHVGETQALQCMQGGNTLGALSVTGNPILDCTQAWESVGESVPEDLVAYLHQGVAVVVLPRAELPRGVQPLPAGTRQDPALIELASSLDDWLEGPPGGCMPVAKAREYAQAQLERLQLTGWSVIGGGTGCASAIPHGSTRTITISAEPRDGRGDLPAALTSLRRELLSTVVARCTTLEKARELVEAAGQNAQVVSPELVITTVPVPSATCTRVDLILGGSSFVRLYGPPSTPS